ncbi:MAG: zinc ribbon domain-containing protein [Candidatus Lokiarchaeota archaeon]|nr:zinc ribbon domain-containing protein [Candidatus Lokiarchaeota archaeon]
MFANLFGDVPFVPEAGEQVVGQYKTIGYFHKHRPGGDAGALIITSYRVVFFRRENVVKKIIQSITGKQEAPGYKLHFSINLGQVFKVKKGSTSGRKFIAINGTYFYLENADPRPIEKILKTAMKSGGTLMKPGAMPPAGVPSLNQIAQPAFQGVPQPAVVPQAPQAGQRACAYCGAGNKVDAQFCKNCGARMQG